MLISCLIISPFYLAAKEKRGAELSIQVIGGLHLKGELITIKRDALLLLTPAGADAAIDIDDVSVINIVKKSRALEGAGYGCLIGVIPGAILGAGAEIDRDASRFGAIMMSGAITAGIGGAMGGIWGAFAGRDEIILITGTTEAEKRGIMERLRQLSRVPDFQ